MLMLTILVDADELDEGLREQIGTELDRIFGASPAVICSDVDRNPAPHAGCALISRVQPGPDASWEQISLFRQLQAGHDWPNYNNAY